MLLSLKLVHLDNWIFKIVFSLYRVIDIFQIVGIRPVGVREQQAIDHYPSNSMAFQ